MVLGRGGGRKNLQISAIIFITVVFEDFFFRSVPVIDLPMHQTVATSTD